MINQIVEVNNILGRSRCFDSLAKKENWPSKYLLVGKRPRSAVNTPAPSGASKTDLTIGFSMVPPFFWLICVFAENDSNDKM